MKKPHRLSGTELLQAVTTMPQTSKALATVLHKPLTKGGWPGRLEAVSYGLLAAAVASAITLPVVPLANVVIVSTVGAGTSAGISWLQFALQGDRSKLARFIIVSSGTAILFVVPPFPVWFLVSNLFTLVDLGVATHLNRDGSAVGFLMLGVVIGAPLVFVLSLAGTAVYCALRNLWMLVWDGFE